VEGRYVNQENLDLTVSGSILPQKYKLLKDYE